MRSGRAVTSRRLTFGQITRPSPLLPARLDLLHRRPVAAAAQTPRRAAVLALAALLKQGRPLPLEYLQVEHWPRGASASAHELAVSRAFPQLSTFVMGNERIDVDALRRQLIRRGLFDVS